MSKLTIRVDPKTGKNYLPRHIREEGFTGKVEVLVNALTVTFIKPGSNLADVDRSLDLIRQDIALRQEKEVKGATPMEKREEPQTNLPTRQAEVASAGPHPVFSKYTRAWLSEISGYSKGYLCRVATGKIPLTQSFIERVSFALREPKEALFLPEDAEES